MNIAFFLLPKQEVVCVPKSATLRQTLERMEHHRYTAVPILDREGLYVGTVTEGDLLWHMKNNDLSFDQVHKVKLTDVPLRVSNRAVHVDANIRDLISLVKTQNFVPVVDDMNRFIGIVRRSDIIDYCEKNMLAEEASKQHAKFALGQ
ncbi:CBS domain-containing protein [Paenibacillus sp. MMS18-CY102]|uniref:CBS domain-containing protein n=1 Tax=Paenibacillus sp. MMS18-CY102 TaxID=2682849 RepID=UPI0013656D92|nr:CBS domain-containing protein [Paenibacillus sp. MMS18-CY102]MWC29104.1 CBS domain-containing protein [Paenibacillus sp. MMS18-CY102]